MSASQIIINHFNFICCLFIHFRLADAERKKLKELSEVYTGILNQKNEVIWNLKKRYSQYLSHSHISVILRKVMKLPTAFSHQFVRDRNTAYIIPTYKIARAKTALFDGLITRR